MPPPLGPRSSVGFPLAEGYLAPLHLDLRTLKLFVTTGSLQRLAMRGLPALGALLRTPVGDKVADTVVRRLPEGPNEQQRRSRWTILAEARSGPRWRNVTLTGADVYGLTAEFLTLGAITMSAEDYSESRVLSPVQAVGLETWQKEFIDQGVALDVYEPVT